MSKATEGRTEAVFLHVCCGPCAEWPIQALKEEGLGVTGFFYNPNIHPIFEWTRRRDYAQQLFLLNNIPFVCDDAYMEDVWLDKVYEKEFASRCDMCYAIRLNRTAQEAKSRGFNVFSTTLLVSPYQNYEAIIKAGQLAAQLTGLTFLVRDFRPGFRQGQQMAKDHGLYRQKYCGCIFSLEESSFVDKIKKDFM